MNVCLKSNDKFVKTKERKPPQLKKYQKKKITIGPRLENKTLLLQLSFPSFQDKHYLWIKQFRPVYPVYPVQGSFYISRRPTSSLYLSCPYSCHLHLHLFPSTIASFFFTSTTNSVCVFVCFVFGFSFVVSLFFQFKQSPWKHLSCMFIRSIVFLMGRHKLFWKSYSFVLLSKWFSLVCLP